MKRIVMFFVILFASASLAIANPTKGLPSPAVTPENAEMGTYPTFDGPLSPAEQAMLGLRVTPLDEGGFYLTQNRKTGVYEHRWLNAGTLVLVDIVDEVQYQQSCGNRAVAMPKPVEITSPAPCPPCPPVATAAKSASTTPLTDEILAKAKNNARFMGAVAAYGGATILLPLLIFFGLIALGIYLLYKLLV